MEEVTEVTAVSFVGPFSLSSDVTLPLLQHLDLLVHLRLYSVLLLIAHMLVL